MYHGYINGNEFVAVKTGKGILVLTHTLFCLCFFEHFPALLSVANKDKLLKEVIMMLSFDHPNVMSLIGMCLDGEVPLLIMPFMSGGSVLEFVTQSRENLHFTHGAAESEA